MSESTAVRPAPRHLLDTGGAAAYLKITPRGVRTLVANGALPFYRVGRWIRFSQEDLDNYLAGRRVEADGAA